MTSWDTVAVAGSMARSHDETIRKLDNWIDYARKLEGHLKEAQSREAIKEAKISGLVAQVNALHASLSAVDPSNQLLQKTNIKYQNGQHTGKMKSKLRLVFEEAHDAAASKLGITNPVAVRDN